MNSILSAHITVVANYYKRLHLHYQTTKVVRTQIHRLRIVITKITICFNVNFDSLIFNKFRHIIDYL